MAETKDYAERNDAEMMSDRTLNKLLEYLRAAGWTDSQIIDLLAYISNTSK